MIRKFAAYILFATALVVAATMLRSASSWANEVPPGCFPTSSIGGCSGKNLIDSIDFKAPTCLLVIPNNCNGGVLEIQNSCDTSLQLGDLVLPAVPHTSTAPFPSFPTIELFRDKQGIVKAKLSNGNYESYTPSETEVLEIKGTLGSQPVVLSYRKTKPLCR
jgi:hypothetical protein